MSQSKFERKLQSNGKPNPKYIDLLEEDKPLAGQKFVCVSFVSPEKILKQKEIFFFERTFQLSLRPPCIPRFKCDISTL